MSARPLYHRFDVLVSRRFDIALAVSAATLGYLSHERDAYPKPNERLVPLLKQHVHREYPATAQYWDQAEQVVERARAWFPSWPSVPSPSLPSPAVSHSGDVDKFKLSGSGAAANSEDSEEQALQQWMAQLGADDRK